MARTKKLFKQEPVQWHDVENDSKPEGQQYRALKPVLGYQTGEVFTAHYNDIKRQLKHKSIEAA